MPEYNMAVMGGGQELPAYTIEMVASGKHSHTMTFVGAAKQRKLLQAALVALRTSAGEKGNH